MNHSKIACFFLFWWVGLN